MGLGEKGLGDRQDGLGAASICLDGAKVVILLGGVPGSRGSASTRNVKTTTLSFELLFEEMELALEFWSLPYRFFMNPSANLLVFVPRFLGVSWGRLELDAS